MRAPFWIRAGAAGAVVAALAACAVGPDYRAPAVAPAVVANAATPDFQSRDPEAAWWQEFSDAELDSLVQRALQANLDLRIAVARVQEARAVFVQNAYDFAPHVPLTAQ